MASQDAVGDRSAGKALPFGDVVMSNPVNPKINLVRNPSELPLEVDMEAFFDFSFWLAEELVDLIATQEEEARRNKRTRQRDRVLAIVESRRRQAVT